jgi:galactokinase
MKTEIEKLFNTTFGYGKEEISTYFCPGRINLIGEHIDYNGGFVLPAALTLGITGLFRKRFDSIVRFASLNLPEVFEIDLSLPLGNKPEQKWANYPIGVLAFLLEEGSEISGADIFFASNLPDGAGVSSSAAIEVLTTFMLLTENNYPDTNKVWMSLFAQKVENKFIGVNCGIMDQFAVANGLANNAMLLNCENLAFSYIPLDLEDYKIVILNTNKRRELAESKYNERRSECDAALLILNKTKNFKDLCSADLLSVQELIEDPILKARAKHVVSENLRVIEAAKVLQAGDLDRFGKLLNESHASLRYDYEVTGPELDTITTTARNHPGCIGARMTGAGFGGCAIALVQSDHIEDFIKTVGQEYESLSGLVPAFYVSEVGDGVKKMILRKVV